MSNLIKFYSKQNAGVYVINQWSEAGLLDSVSANYFINADYETLDVFYVGY